MSSPMHGKAAMCRMGKTVRAGVPRCPRFPLANRESGTIGNLDALSFLNGATVGYDESRVPAGDVRRTGKRWKRHGGQDACKRPGGYFSGPFTCTRLREGWMLSCRQLRYGCF